MFDLVSQVASALPQANPAVSLDSSAPIAPDFSSLLLQLVGNSIAPLQQPGTASPLLNVQAGNPQTADAQSGPPQLPQLNNTAPPGTAQTGITQCGQPFFNLQLLNLNTAPAPETVALPHISTKDVAVPEETATLEPVLLPSPHADDTAASAPDSGGEPQRDSKTAVEAMLAEIKKLEITVQHEAVQPLEMLPVELAKQVMITTDPILNIQQAQLPPRVTTLQRVVLDTSKPADRSKTETGSATETRASSVTSVADTATTFQSVEQALPAQQIEIPQMPKLQVVRTVSMELGDPGSQVIVRIEDRTGGMAFHLGAGNEILHRSLEASVASLVHALKQEHIDVSNVEVSRKSPIDKVRRMKEAH